MDPNHISPIKTFKVSIRGEVWHIFLFKPSEYDYIFPGSLAMTMYNHNKRKGKVIRCINFTTSHIAKYTIAHELMHAYLSYVDLSKYSYGQGEERVCETIGNHYKRLVYLTEYIYKTLKM